MTPPKASPESSRSGMSIGGRMMLLGIVVAIVVALVAGVAALPLVRDSAQARAQAELARLADLTATTVTRGPGNQFIVPPQVGTVLEDEGVLAYVVFRETAPPPQDVLPFQVERVTTGRPVSAVNSGDDGDVLVEGRPLRRGTGIILVQPAEIALAPAFAVFWRIAAALALGIGIAIVVAVIVSRRMSRSLRAAADAADRLAAGERDVVVAPEGPAEISRIAESINRLNEALVVSEGRQREFLLSVSHELRTPLTALLGYAQAIKDEVVDPDDLPRIGQVMTDESVRLQRLVTDLLDLARLEAVDFTFSLVETDLSTVMHQAVEVWRDRCDRAGVNVGFEEDPDFGGVIARVDPVRLRQIIDNLAENALRVTPEGGRIIFGLHVVEGDDVSPPREHAQAPGESSRSAVIEVRDTGPGLTVADIPVAFTPGALHERYRGLRPVGTGVGLALVARLARGLRGRAEAATAPEGGARFAVILPLDV